mmetsp:Transcript_19476/g.23323  ORF Transcript_19476/g.23323 Transcript_19476/m.23323 type:complete len:143 (-) Transcript_19476:278-706(-)
MATLRTVPQQLSRATVCSTRNVPARCGKSTALPSRANTRAAVLRSEFQGTQKITGGLCGALAGLSLNIAPRRTTELVSRSPLTVEANRKKGLGCTLSGTRRKQARVSGFRARMRTVGGRKVLKRRRQKGRHNLVPASKPKAK